MCGRVVVIKQVEVIKKTFGIGNIDERMLATWATSYNAGPGSYLPVILDKDPHTLSAAVFGFTPSFSKNPMYLFNARAEGDGNSTNDPNYTGGKGIINKPAFRQAIRSQRCLIIASAFYEGPEKEKLSKPYLCYLRERRPFAFAGIWNEWTNKETAEIFNTCAIITTVANPLLRAIGHRRSPVILHRRDEKTWLGKTRTLANITSLLEPYPAEEMNAYPVDPKMKNPRAAGPELVKPIGERMIPEHEFRIEDRIKIEGMGRAKSNDPIPGMWSK